MGFSRFRLQNGLKVIIAPSAGTRAVATLLLVGVGSRHEVPKLSGISHFFEHMAFKGTKKRPRPADISQPLDAVGAEFNAFTTREATGYFVKVDQLHLRFALEVLEDIIFHSQFPRAEIEKERGVMVEEINLRNDTPPALVEDLAHETLWGKTGLGRPVVGRKETILTLKRADFLTFHRRFYQPANMVLALAGAVSGKTKEHLEEIFGRFPRESSSAILGVEKVRGKLTSRLRVFKRRLDQVHLVVTWPALRRDHPARFVLKVLNNLFGGMMSSRLFQKVREASGLGYYVHSQTWEAQETGALAAAAGVKTQAFEKAAKMIVSEGQNLASKRVSPKELQRAKENLVGHLVLGLEDSLALAEFGAEQELFLGKVQSLSEVTEQVKKVTASDILALSEVIFQKGKFSVTALGPIDSHLKAVTEESKND